MPHRHSTIFFLIFLGFLAAMFMVLPVGLRAQKNTAQAASVPASSAQPDSLEISTRLRRADSLLVISGNTAQAELVANEIYNTLNDSVLKNIFVEQLGRLGVANRQQYRFDKALFWHQLQQGFAIKAGDVVGEITALNNLGLLYRRMDRYALSIEAYQKALERSESSNYSRGLVYATNGLGNIYLALENLEEAMRNFRACLKLEQQNNNLNGVAINLNNIGHVYLLQKEIDNALEYFMLSLEVNRELNNKRGIAICYNDLGEVYLQKEEHDKAQNYFMMSLQLNTSINDKYYLAINNLKVAEIYLIQKNYEKALPHLEASVKLAELTNNRSVMKEAYQHIYQIHKERKNTSLALHYLEKATVMNDSILNENTQKIVYQMQATFNREQADNKIALLENEKQLADLRIKRQNLYNLLNLIGLLTLMALLTGVLFFSRFISNRNKLLKANNKELEAARDQLKAYADQLLLAKQEAEQSNMLKSQFLANMSHEIRTPMNSVIGFTDILAATTQDPKQLGYLDAIRMSGQSLLVLINDILDLSKIESGKIEIEFKPLDFGAVLHEVRRVFEPQCRDKDIVLEIDIHPSVPRIVHFSESSLRQIMFNLVGNAIKFTNSGKVTIRARVINQRSFFGTLEIEVADTGAGMHQHDLAHIFEAFYQTATGKTEARGTGLGLTITKRLVEALGGNITATSSIGEGTQFRLQFFDLTMMPERSHLRLMSHEQLELNPSEVCLLSKQIKMKTLVDQVLEKSGLRCDVFGDAALFFEYNQRSIYRSVLVDASFLPVLNQIQDSDNRLSELLPTPCLLLSSGSYHSSHLLENKWRTFTLPDQSDELAAHLQLQRIELQGANAFKNRIQFEDSPEIRLLAAAFTKAEQSQFMDDCAVFADQLEAYIVENNFSELSELMRAYKAGVEAFDIEEVSKYLKMFRLQTNITEFCKAVTPQKN